MNLSRQLAPPWTADANQGRQEISEGQRSDGNSYEYPLLVLTKQVDKTFCAF